MHQSVPSQTDVQATFAATLFDEWCRSGLRDVVVCPGSRSTPLALACAERDDLTVHVRIDERSAAFFAIGRALVSARPVAIVVTSGTAAAELHAAVAEADLANISLLVITADRPPELHGVGAPQTIDQRFLYGSMVRLYEEPGVARLEAAGSWRALANRLWSNAVGVIGRPGPVHLNAAFIEPLVGAAFDLPAPRSENRPWRTFEVTPLAHVPLDVNAKRVLCVVGQGVDAVTIGQCRELDWVVLGDATAQGATPFFDTLLRDDRFAREARPDLVIRMGGLPASKVLQERLREWGSSTTALRGAGPVADPDGLIDTVLEGLPSADAGSLRADPSYAKLWREASESVGTLLRAAEADGDGLHEPMIARVVVDASAEFAVPLVVGSSMPVRDVEWWADARTSPTFSNRGVNGIDGVVSTLFGVGAGSKAIGLVGDVTMLHDVSGLVDGVGDAEGSCVLVVIDNGGGGIFSFLSQASLLATSRFEQLFGTPRGHDLPGIAAAFGHHSVTVNTRGELRSAVAQGLDRPGVTVIVASVGDRAQNVRIHDALNADVLRRRSVT